MHTATDVAPPASAQRSGQVLRHLCVAYGDEPPGPPALGHAAQLARRSGARLTVAHVAPPVDEPVDDREELLVELLGLREDIHRRRRLTTMLATLLPDVETQVRVLTGRVAPQILALLDADRPDLVVAGTRPLRGADRFLASPLSHALLDRAPCPVVLVSGEPPPWHGQPVVVAFSGAAGDAALPSARALAADLRARVLCARAPRRASDGDALRAAAEACRRHRPALAVVHGERLPGMRRRLGASRSDALIEATESPLLILTPDARPQRSASPIVSARHRHAAPAMASSHPLSHRRPPAGDVTADRSGSRPRHGPSLLWQLFAVYALVLVAALAVLVVAPIRVSTGVVLTEVLVLSAGLAIVLAVHLMLLRRTLAPLRLLTEVIGTIDARRPGRRMPVAEAGTAEVTALADAFNAMLDRLEDERRRSVQRALAAQDDERLRIAREMHDQVGQTLTAVTIQAERAAQMDDPVDRRLLERIAHTALQSLDDVRRIGRELRPEALDDLGLGNALIALCRRMTAQSGVRVAPALEPGVPSLPSEAELVVYRIAQEAVTNALRHADASRIEVALRSTGEAVELTVRDDGRGMPETTPDDSTGLSGMRERALLVGGRLGLRSRPNEGTEVRLTLPLDEATP